MKKSFIDSGSPSIIGLFGTGHLGQTIAHGLLTGGVERGNVLLCHSGSPNTVKRLEKVGLADLVVSPEELCSQAEILLYIVRPSDFMAIENYSLKEDCLFISFLGGISLSQLPVSLSEARLARIMPSSPDTIRSGQGIAATYPAKNPNVKKLLAMLTLQEVPLNKESDIHAFTGLGLCLPIALTYWDSLNKDFDEFAELEYIKIASKYGLQNPSKMITWARSVQQKNLKDKERQSFLAQAATPGGVTEAVLNGIQRGEPLHLALELGLLRSKSLAEG